MKPEVLLINENTKVFEKLADRQKSIIEILKQVDELSFSNILSKLDNPPSEKTLSRDLTALKKFEIIDV